MRPRSLDEILGQEALLGPAAPLRRAIEADELRSLILWGPPGCGKTTIARLIAGSTRATFLPFSAVLSGIKEVREVMENLPLDRFDWHPAVGFKVDAEVALSGTLADVVKVK